MLGSRELGVDVAAVVTLTDAAAALDAAVAATHAGAIVLQPRGLIGDGPRRTMGIAIS
jgi:hypothetical protein